MKYRRPRGIYCAGGHCPNCLVRVEGVSFKRACVTPVTDGMVVESHTRGILAGYDPLRAADYVGFLFPLGFQYRYFKRQGRLYNLWEAFLRRVAGHAKVPPSMGAGPDVDRRTVDLCVVGAGPSGIGAAAAALDSGLSVALISMWWGFDSVELVERRFARAPKVVRDAALKLIDHPDVVVGPARAIGWYDGVTVADNNGQLVEISSERSVLATGAYERALVFDGNDKPGIMLSAAAVKLAYRDGVAPGSRAVVTTCTDDGYQAALALAASGVKIVSVLEERAVVPPHLKEALTREGIPVVSGVEIVRASGSMRVKKLTYTAGGRKRRVKCDLVAMSGGWQAADELRFQATSSGQAVIEGEFAQRKDLADPKTESEPLLQGVGAVVGTRSALDAFNEGYVVGLHAARAAGLPVKQELMAVTAQLTTGGLS